MTYSANPLIPHRILEYSISDLHNLLDLNLRKSMFLNKNSDMYQVALDNKQNIEQNGNPIYNKLYKNMKINVLRDHLNQVQWVILVILM